MEVKREQIIIGPDAEFHMLRHFRQISQDMLHGIQKNGHPESEIQQMLTAPGSRFSEVFAQSINSLLDRLFTFPCHTIEGITGNLEVSWDIPKNEWADGIGTTGVISIQELNEEQPLHLYEKENRGIIL
jgi:hypothetical protein